MIFFFVYKNRIHTGITLTIYKLYRSTHVEIVYVPKPNQTNVGILHLYTYVYRIR